MKLGLSHTYLTVNMNQHPMCGRWYNHNLGMRRISMSLSQQHVQGSKRFHKLVVSILDSSSLLSYLWSCNWSISSCHQEPNCRIHGADVNFFRAMLMVRLVETHVAHPCLSNYGRALAQRNRCFCRVISAQSPPSILVRTRVMTGNSIFFGYQRHLAVCFAVYPLQMAEHSRQTTLAPLD